MIECLLCLALSPFFSTYDSSIRSDPGLAISIGDPIYLSVSYEAPDLKIVGQHIPTEAVGLSVGVVRGLSDKISLFVEGGYYWPSASPQDAVRDEVVGRVLENDHGKPSFKARHHEYELEGGFGGRVGLDVQVSKRLSLFGAYRFVKFDETFRMCNFEDACSWPVPEGGKYWINQDSRSFSSVQVGFSLRF